MSSEPIFYECLCGYETYVAAYSQCPGCGRSKMLHTKLRHGRPRRERHTRDCAFMATFDNHPPKDKDCDCGYDAPY